MGRHHDHSLGTHPKHDHDHDDCGHAHVHRHGDHDRHGHHPGHSHGAGASARRLAGALAILAAFTLVEAVGGWWVNSLALLSDAAHMLTDSAALAFALLAARLAQRPASATLTYGHGRWQPLAAFVNGLLLLALTVALIVESVRRLLQPEVVDGGWMLVIAILGGLANVGALLALEGARSLNERGARLHVLSDLLGSVAAIVAAGLILWRGWWIADPLLSLLVCALILRSGWRLTRDAARVLLEAAPQHLGPAQVQRALKSVDAVRDVHHVHVWTLDGSNTLVTLHALLQPGQSSQPALQAIQLRLREELGIEHVTVQLETTPCGQDAHPACHVA